MRIYIKQPRNKPTVHRKEQPSQHNLVLWHQTPRLSNILFLLLCLWPRQFPEKVSTFWRTYGFSLRKLWVDNFSVYKTIPRSGWCDKPYDEQSLRFVIKRQPRNNQYLGKIYHWSKISVTSSKVIYMLNTTQYMPSVTYKVHKSLERNTTFIPLPDNLSF